MAAAGVRATPSVLIVPLEQSFGWSRDTISFGTTCQNFDRSIGQSCRIEAAQALWVSRTCSAIRLRSCSS